jgi:hypothetical protein
MEIHGDLVNTQGVGQFFFGRQAPVSDRRISIRLDWKDCNTYVTVFFPGENYKYSNLVCKRLHTEKKNLAVGSWKIQED